MPAPFLFGRAVAGPRAGVDPGTGAGDGRHMAIDLETAARAAAAALDAGRGTAADCTTLGWHRAVSGDHAGAASLFERALQLNPREVEAMVGLAGLHRAAGRLRDAVLRCDAAIA